MPPLVPRKRLRTPSPDRGNKAAKSSANGRKNTPTSAEPPPRKSTLFDDLDSLGKKRSVEKTKSALQQMHEDDDDSSSLSSLSDSDVDFEDVLTAEQRKLVKKEDSESDGEDEGVEFEDVPNHEAKPDPIPSGDLSITLYQDAHVPLSTNLGKKGPSKREKLTRNSTHCIHVQFLLWHNAIRNSWLCDQEVQAIMISHLPPRMWEEVDRWRRSSGLEDENELPPKTRKDAKETKISSSGKDLRMKTKSKMKGKKTNAAPTRDWGDAAARLEKGVPDLSHGDPLFRLMKTLSSWWKQRFKITAPGLRKFGYLDARRLGKWRRAFDSEEHDPEKYGEKICNLEDFRRHAQVCEGSRDVGAQLFTALLRGLGLDARMIANLQTLGYGFSKSEDADEEKFQNGAKQPETSGTNTPNSVTAKKAQPPAKKKVSATPARRSTRKNDNDALKIDLDDSDEYAEPLSEDESIIDVTDEHVKPRPALKVYDKDLDFPHYWTEVLSPVTHKYLPVDSIVKSVTGLNRELVESLEPRGSKADKAKQIMAYVVGYSKDGTAKDVTVRYLRKQLFPGRTKGIRMGVEKIPVYNKHGKVKRYEHFDWFKFVMSGYVRGNHLKYPITEIDKLEAITDLKPAVPEKKEVKEGEETLQYYKSSPEFVLERHLRREEALLPTAEPVKAFRNKTKGGKVEEEPVYLRKDVVAVKSAETWHKQGRAPRLDAKPLKHAPYRAATTNRRREIAEAEARTGEKVLQPLYSEAQTEWIIPDPIQNGVIPKNDYGNIDMFAEHMCPEGAVHLPYRGAVRVCKRLEIDYAEAVVGFEFGHRMAVPVIQGVVVAEEHEQKVLEGIEKDEAERARKEDEKRRKAALTTWRKFLVGLRVTERIKKEYGHLEDKAFEESDKDGENEGGFMRDRDEDMAGGFLPEGHDEEEYEDPRHHQTSGYFPIANEEDIDEDDANDPFEIEHGLESRVSGTHHPAETSKIEPEDDVDAEVEDKESVETEEKTEAKPAARPRRKVARPKPKPKPKLRTSTRRRSRRMKLESSDEESDENDNDDDEDFEL